jgi:hypothetical protein
LTPPVSSTEFDELGVEALTKRNNNLNCIFTLLMFIGLIFPLSFFIYFPKGASVRAIGLVALAFGLMVDLPVAVIAAVTLRQSFKRFREFWRFYELKYGIGVRGIAWVYTPIGLLGVIGLFMIVIG